ncbi:MAG TPA: phosphomannomutase/phosphoglucomutase, partial [Anaerolineae bacterium]|nr:phosphomannomutase/phosphoglucomutase [Anaerolineae bacterium]
ENLDPQVCTVLGAAFGTMLGADGSAKVVVGRDGRLSSPDLSRALIAGLVGAGCDVTDIGVVTTPMVYFAVKHLQAAGGIAVTASHNPPQYNGLKLRRGAVPFSGEEIQRLRKLAETGPFFQERGHLSKNQSTKDAYLHAVKDRVGIGKGYKLVIDAGNGAAGLVAPELFRQLGCDVIELYCDLDGRFPRHLPDPSEEANLQDLVAAVKREHADLGFAYDGDGDRVAMVTDSGEILAGDLVVALIAGEILKRESGTVVFDLLSSQALIDVIERQGGVAWMAPTGYTRVMEAMRNSGALIGGEASGHIFFRDDLFDFDDGVFASAKALEVLSSTGRKLSELAAEIPRYYAAPEVKLPCADEHKFAVLDRIRQHFTKLFEMVDLDGLRIQFDGGWASIRASHTTPNIAVVAEASSPERLEEIKGGVMEELAACCADEISSGLLGFQYD